jgi:hypothetical protein
MAIPVHLQQFKAAGIYRVVFDKSTILGVDSEILRLVVGYSEIGPFNIPTYIKSVSDFKAIYGDISKKLEKRGIYFHRLAIQALASGPILCLNLKKFDGETVDGATISPAFNPSYASIEPVKINVEDIYDTSRFWELSAEKLINLKSANRIMMDQYINICTTNTKESSGTYFIRKASGNKVSQYNISVSDWYSDRVDEMPEYLYPYRNSLISDFFAEIYVFKGHFQSDQVMSSTTLKNYFDLASNDEGLLNEQGFPKGADEIPGLQLKPYVTNAYGDPVDTLDALYSDDTASPIAHYVGCLIPYFKNKKGQYMSLDILFNSDIDVHNMMMSFNTDILEEGMVSIDLSGRLSIKTNENTDDVTELNLPNLAACTAKTNLLSNMKSKVVVDNPSMIVNVVKIAKDGTYKAIDDLDASGKTRISGSLYVNSVDVESRKITLKQIGSDQTVDIEGFENTDEGKKSFTDTVVKIKAGKYDDEGNLVLNNNGEGTYFTGSAFINNGEFTMEGPQMIVSSITRLEQTDNNIYSDDDTNMNISFTKVEVSIKSHLSNDKAVYGSSVCFLSKEGYETGNLPNGENAIFAQEAYDISLGSILNVGDCLLAADGTSDRDENGEPDEPDGFFDNVYVMDIYIDENGKYVIKTSGAPKEYNVVKYVEDENGTFIFDEETQDYKAKPETVEEGTTLYKKEENSCFIRIENGLNQEVGQMMPQYLQGYIYKNYKPEGTDMLSKLNWQKFILSALTEYKGLRTGLLNKSDIDYRYIVDTFESYVDNGLKKVLCYLAKEKQSAFAILNFPAVKTFIKCPYSSYTDAKGVFKVEYIVDGFNKKKPAGVRFSLPEDADGASFCAFYTPLKFSDGYLDMIIPSAGLVSNLFMEKYKSRQPYYIIAGPNYANIRANGLVGPDYKYSQDELQIIEPYGVNCMIYRPTFGTFINANQTAKQTPVSALSKVNVRELVIYLQDEIEKVLQAYQWEFNNPVTRSAIKKKADLICARVAANGGIQKYLNVMDESNNTPEIIDNEMAVLSTHIEPGMGCGKMVQELTLYRTGQMTAAISG